MNKLLKFSHIPRSRRSLLTGLVLCFLVLSIVPVTATAPQVITTQKMYGINRSGGEFGDSHIPGTYGTDYIYPTEAAEFTPYALRGLTVVRIPFLWERLQPEANGPIVTAEAERLRKVLDAAGANGMQVILDMHNYGRYKKVALTEQDAAMFADAWGKLIVWFMDHPALYGVEIMNEPHDMPGDGAAWNKLAQAATDRIRTYTSRVWVLVPGYSWQSARFWRDNNENLSVFDPSGRVMYTAHIYFDPNGSGVYSESVGDAKPDASKVATAINPFLTWLSDHKVLGMFTEYGVPKDKEWQPVLRQFLKTIDEHPYVVGGTYWAGGSWWGDYALSIEPAKDKPTAPQFVQLYGFPTHVFPPSLPKGVKAGDVVSFTGDPALYVAYKDGLYPFAQYNTYLNYKKTSRKTQIKNFRAKLSYTIRMLPIEDGGGQ